MADSSRPRRRHEASFPVLRHEQVRLARLPGGWTCLAALAGALATAKPEVARVSPASMSVSVSSTGELTVMCGDTLIERARPEKWQYEIMDRPFCLLSSENR